MQFLIVFAVLLGGCAATGSFSYKLYPGPVLADSELATVRFGSRLEHVAIDGLSVQRSEYGTAKLWPGLHTFDFTSVRIVAELEKGHSYELLATDVWPFCCPDPVLVSGRELHSWIQDADTGAVVGEIREQ